MHGLQSVRGPDLEYSSAHFMVQISRNSSRAQARTSIKTSRFVGAAVALVRRTRSAKSAASDPHRDSSSAQERFVVADLGRPDMERSSLAWTYVSTQLRRLSAGRLRTGVPGRTMIQHAGGGLVETERGLEMHTFLVPCRQRRLGRRG